MGNQTLSDNSSIDTRVDVSSEQDFRNRFDKIHQELLEVWNGDENKDKIEWIDKNILDGKFAEDLLKHPDQLTTLRTFVTTIKSNKLSWKAWKAIKDLSKFLDDIWDIGRMEEDYQEFLKIVDTPNKLNTMKSREIRRLNLYLWMHEDKALDIYNRMKPAVGHFEEKWMKSEDQRYFNEIWDSLKSAYSDSVAFLENDYPKVKWLQPTVASLKALVGENWDGSDNINITDVANSVVDKQKVILKFRELNQQRIESNKQKVVNITVDYSSEKLEFTKEEWELKYKGNSFTLETMMELYGEQIKSKASDWTDFVNENEKNGMIDENKSAIYDKLKSTILADAEVKVNNAQQVDNPGTADTEWSSEDSETTSEWLGNFEVNKDIIKIKDEALKTAITSDPKFCDNLDGDTVKFDISAVKTYLEWLKEKQWKDFKSLTWVEREKWVIAVQIALKYLNNKEWWTYKDKCDVEWIDGIRKSRTIAWIKWFQNEWNQQHSSETKLNPDGAPGQYTIVAILWELWGTETTSTSSEWELTSSEWESTSSEGSSETTTDASETGGNTQKPITDKINKMGSDNVLDLSDMTSLDESGATEIADWLKDKSGVIVKLDKLSRIDGAVAQNLSKINWKIRIDGILNTDLDTKLENANFVNVLVVLTWETLTIESSSEEVSKKVKEKNGSIKIETVAS